MANRIVVQYGYRSDAELVSFLLRLNSSAISIKWSDDVDDRKIFISWENNDQETRKEVNDVLDEISKIFKQPKITLEMEEERQNFEGEKSKTESELLSESKIDHVEESGTFDSIEPLERNDTLIVVNVSKETNVTDVEGSSKAHKDEEEVSKETKVQITDALGDVERNSNEDSFNETKILAETPTSPKAKSPEKFENAVDDVIVENTKNNSSDNVETLKDAEISKAQGIEPKEEKLKPSLEEISKALDELLSGIKSYNFAENKEKALQKFCIDYKVEDLGLKFAILYFHEIGSFDKTLKEISAGQKRNKALVQVTVQKNFKKWMSEAFPGFAVSYPDISIKMFLETFKNIHLNS